MSYRESILRELSFVSLKTTGLNFWMPTVVSSIEEGATIGKERAEQFLRFMREHEDPVLLTRVGNSMMGEVGFDIVERSFTHHLAEAYITGR